MEGEMDLKAWAKTAKPGEKLELPKEPGFEAVEHIERVLEKL